MNPRSVRGRDIGFALLAAALYALCAPLSKLLLRSLSPTLLAALLYLGAGLGMAIFGGIRHLAGHGGDEQKLTKADLLYTVGMVVLDIAAPILLLFGLSATTAANASLLNNFEIVATSVLALLLFRERISKRLWLGIGLITAASVILSFDGFESFTFSGGSLLILAACLCWGLENNCTRRLSGKDPLRIVVIKGLFSGLGALGIAAVCGGLSGVSADSLGSIAAALGLGFVAYGLSIFFYVYAQRGLGAARTSAFYAVAPFVGVLLSMVILGELPGLRFYIAAAVMAVGAWFASADSRAEKKT